MQSGTLNEICASDNFLEGYDKALRTGFEKLIGKTLDDRWWEIARMNSKHGGMGLKSGLKTAGAQHLTSLAMSYDDILKFVLSWNLYEVAEETTANWLSRQLGKDVDSKSIVNAVIGGASFGVSGKLSLAQWCEEAEKERVIQKMDSSERLFIESNSGPGSTWVRATPLTWKNWNMKPRLWVVAARRRLYQPVCLRRSNCGACRMGRADIKGEHQVTCGGRGGLIIRHDSIRDLHRKEIDNAGFTTEIVRKAGSSDKSRPGDIKVLNWKDGKDLYIDVVIVIPMSKMRRDCLIEEGVGAAAQNEESRKRKTYEGKMYSKMSLFLPFIMETQGGIGKAAQDFIIEIEEKKRQRSCNLSKACKSVANLSLMISLSLQLQRLNSAMILQRLPMEQVLVVKDIEKLESANKAAITDARVSLNMNTNNIIKVTYSISKPTPCSGDLCYQESSMEEINKPKEDWENVRWEDTEWGAAPCLDGLPKLSQLPVEDGTNPILNRDSLPTAGDMNTIKQKSEPTELHENTADKRAKRFTNKGKAKRGRKIHKDNSTNGLSQLKDHQPTCHNDSGLQDFSFGQSTPNLQCYEDNPNHHGRDLSNEMALDDDDFQTG